jgi:hypothetical protein
VPAIWLVSTTVAHCSCAVLASPSRRPRSRSMHAALSATHHIIAFLCVASDDVPEARVRVRVRMHGAQGMQSWRNRPVAVAVPAWSLGPVDVRACVLLLLS